MKRFMCGAVAVVLAASLSVMAAPKNEAGPGEMISDCLTKVMGKQAFQAKAVMTFTSTDKKNAMPGPMEMQMAFSDGKCRMEMDMSKMMGAAGGEAAGMPDLGKMVTIARPDKKVVYQIMSSMNAYCEMAIPAGAEKAGETPKMDRKVQGTEKIDSYNCEKVLNTITTSDGTKTEVMTWEAKELKGFPIKIETQTPEGKMTMRFKDIKTTKPADSMFEPPAGATKHASMAELMMSAMKGMMPQMPQ